MLLSKGDELKIVQCKVATKTMYRIAPCKKPWRQKHFINNDLAAVATNSHFTQGAIDLAEANGVELIDRDKLIELLNVYPIPRT